MLVFRDFQAKFDFMGELRIGRGFPFTIQACRERTRDALVEFYPKSLLQAAIRFANKVMTFFVFTWIPASSLPFKNFMLKSK